jgi:hypothetical protein
MKIRRPSLSKRFIPAADLRGGFSMVEALLIAAVLGGLVYMSSGVLSDLAKGFVHVRVKQDLITLRKQLIQTLNDDESWKVTFQHPDNLANMKCFTTSPPDCASNKEGIGGPIKIFDRKGNLVFDGLNSANGFTANAVACSEFVRPPANAEGRFVSIDDHSGSDECPYSWQITWSPECPVTGACTAPIPRFKGLFIYNPKDLKRLGPTKIANYDFDFTKGQLENTLEASCVSSGGDYDPITNRCQMNLGDTATCPTGYYLVGSRVITGAQELTCRQLPLPPLEYIVATGSEISCSDTGSGGRAGGVKVSCYGTGNGRNWGWADTANGCRTWEGSGNYGSQGCACNCRAPNPALPHQVVYLSGRGWTPEPLGINPLAPATGSSGGGASGDPGCDSYVNAAGNPLFVWNSTLARCVLQSANLPAGPAPASESRPPMFACTCSYGTGVVLSSRTMDGENCANLGYGDAHNVFSVQTGTWNCVAY